VGFEALAYRQAGQDLQDVVEAGRLPLDPSRIEQLYITGDRRLYAVVRLRDLRAGLDAAAAAFRFGPGELIADRGALRVHYGGDFRAGPRDIFVSRARDLTGVKVYDRAYEAPGADAQAGAGVALHPDLVYPADALAAARRRAAESTTLTFWFRVEEQGYRQNQAVYGTPYRRMVTLAAPSGEALLSLGYEGDGAAARGEAGDVALCRASGLDIGPDAWNLVALSIEGPGKGILLSLNGRPAVQADLGAETSESLLAKGMTFRFGPTEDDGYDAGFYSIALPRYIDRVISQEAIARMYSRGRP
jgi:hypothetical protein